MITLTRVNLLEIISLLSHGGKLWSCDFKGKDNPQKKEKKRNDISEMTLDQFVLWFYTALFYFFTQNWKILQYLLNTFSSLTRSSLSPVTFLWSDSMSERGYR